MRRRHVLVVAGVVLATVLAVVWAIRIHPWLRLPQVDPAALDRDWKVVVSLAQVSEPVPPGPEGRALEDALERLRPGVPSLEGRLDGASGSPPTLDRGSWSSDQTRFRLELAIPRRACQGTQVPLSPRSPRVSA